MADTLQIRDSIPDSEAHVLSLLVANFSGRTKRVTFNGRDYIVARLTTIVPGVLRGSKGGLLYLPDEIISSTKLWDKIPIVVYHPTDPITNKHLSARDQGVLDRQGIGFLLNSRYKGKLIHEGWFDVEKTKKVDPRVYNALINGQPMEVSTGLYTTNEPVPGGATFNGDAYEAIARDYVPDHLAVLPDQIGACSVSDGCGLNVNANPEGCNQYKSCEGSTKALYEKALSKDFKFADLDAHMGHLSKSLSKDDAVKLAHSMNIPGSFKSKGEALKEIRSKIAFRRNTFDRIEVSHHTTTNAFATNEKSMFEKFVGLVNQLMSPARAPNGQFGAGKGPVPLIPGAKVDPFGSEADTDPRQLEEDDKDKKKPTKNESYDCDEDDPDFPDCLEDNTYNVLTGAVQNAWTDEAREAAAAARKATLHAGAADKKRIIEGTQGDSKHKDAMQSSRDANASSKLAEAASKGVKKNGTAPVKADWHTEAMSKHAVAAEDHRNAASNHFDAGNYEAAQHHYDAADQHQRAADAHEKVVKSLMEKPTKNQEYDVITGNSKNDQNDDADAKLVGKPNPPGEDGRHVKPTTQDADSAGSAGVASGGEDDHDPSTLYDKERKIKADKKAGYSEPVSVGNTWTDDEVATFIAYNRDFPQAKRDKMDKDDFAGPNESFPIQKQEDVDAAAKLSGHADNPDAVKAKIKSIAAKKGLKVPDAWTGNCGGGMMTDNDDYNGPHAASKQAAVASVQTDHAGATDFAVKAAGHSKAGASDHAIDHHVKAAEIHEAAATDERKKEEPDSMVASNHDRAASLHRTAASKHQATLNQLLTNAFGSDDERRAAFAHMEASDSERSKSATTASKSAAQKKTRESHTAAAKAHFEAARHHEAGGRKSLGAAHRKAAQEHKAKAAVLHPVKFTKNQEMITMLTRAQKVAALTVNCKCDKDKAALNSLSDETLTRLLLNAAGAEASGGGFGEQAGGEDDDPDAKGGDEEEEKGKALGGSPVPGDGKSGKITDNEAWLAQAPPAIRETVRNALELTNQEKAKLIRRLVANVSDETKRKTLIQNFAKKPLAELRDLASLLPPARQMIPTEPTANYQGAAGVVADMVANSRQQLDQEDILIPPTINFKELSDEQRMEAEKKRRRA